MRLNPAGMAKSAATFHAAMETATRQCRAERIQKSVISTGAEVGQRAERSGETSHFSPPGEGGGSYMSVLRSTLPEEKFEVSPLRSARFAASAPVEMTGGSLDASRLARLS